METMNVVELGRPEAAPALGVRVRMRHEPGQRGGSWVVADEGGATLFSLAHRASGDRRITVRDAEQHEQASLGSRVMSLVENYTLWQGGHPFARVYRAHAHTRPEHWLLEVGGNDALMAVVDVPAATFRLVKGGRDIAVVSRADGARTVEMAPDVDTRLVLALAVLVDDLDDRV